MNWYYVEAGQQAGPVTDEQLQQLVSSGRITSATLVWREGMANWQAYGEVRPEGVSAAATATPTAATGAALAGSPPVAEAACSECGRVFPRDEVIQYGDRYVCATCKPQFVQRLKEGAVVGAALSGPLEFAGFWIRFLAHIIDQVILTVAGMIIGFIFGFAMQSSSSPETAAILQGVLTLFSFLLGMSYEVWFITKYGATPGKMALKLKVVTPEGGPITVGRSFGRYFGKILSACILLIGYIMAAFDDEKRALHDRICNTRVIKT